MKKLMVLAIVLFIFIALFPTQPGALTLVTGLGIRVVAANKTIKQYEDYWGLDYRQIDLNKIDTIFIHLQAAYGSSVDPKQVRIRILPWNAKCVDEESPDQPKEFRFQGMCIDGYYNYHNNTIGIHLGDDPGQGAFAWCNTALSYEFGHVMLRNLRDLCWYFEFNGECQNHYLSWCEE